MSTRCMIHFHDSYSGKAQAIIYRHSDGYPGTQDGKEYGVLPDLQEFFALVKEQCKGTMFGMRFEDPEYLAAKFVVWQAGENSIYSVGERDKQHGFLNFGSIGVALADHSDIEYRYHIWCGKLVEKTGFPQVTHEEAWFPWELDEDPTLLSLDRAIEALKHQKEQIFEEKRAEIAKKRKNQRSGSW